MLGLSIIIVNYNSAQLLLNCLESIYKFGFECNSEIIVVDNCSSGNDEHILTGQYPDIVWHQMGYNAGFSRANNQGIRISQYDYILLLNPDTIILDNSINKCFRYFSNSTFSACGVQLLNPDLSLQISGSKFFFGGLNYLLPIPYIGPFFKFLASIINVKPPHIRESAPISYVDWINGAFLMTKKSVINKAGLLDEQFFLYGEEIEWCNRLSKYGRLVIFGDIVIIHVISGSIQKATKSNDNSYSNLFDKKGAQIMVSNQLLILKKFGVFWFFVHLLFHTIGMVLSFFFFPFYSFLPQKSIILEYKKAKMYSINVLKIWNLVPRYLFSSHYFFKSF
jgi:GT2 family glycosyltransferase